jgi:hypothetical protein
MLARAGTLQRLGLSSCDLTSAGVEAIAEGLAKAEGLTLLDMSNNGRIGDGGATVRGGVGLGGLFWRGARVGREGARARGR